MKRHPVTSFAVAHVRMDDERAEPDSHVGRYLVRAAHVHGIILYTALFHRRRRRSFSVAAVDIHDCLYVCIGDGGGGGYT